MSARWEPSLPSRPSPLPGPWVLPPEAHQLDRLERELVEDLIAAILSAKYARRDASDNRPGREPAGAVSYHEQLTVPTP